MKKVTTKPQPDQLREVMISCHPEEALAWEQYARRCRMDRHTWSIMCFLHAAQMAPAMPVAVDAPQPVKGTGHKRVKIRAPQEQHERWQKEADLLKLSISAWMRLVLNCCCDENYAMRCAWLVATCKARSA